MRNTIFSSVSPQLYNSGNNEVQMPNLDISMQVDSIITNVHRDGFSTDSRLFKDDNQLRDGGFAVSCQSLIDNYPQDFQSITTSCENVSRQNSYLLSQKRSLPQLDVDSEPLQNARIFGVEANDLVRRGGIVDGLASDKIALNVRKKISRKKIKVNSSCDEQWPLQVEETSTEIQDHKVPVRRSQKLSDKITALQKLVSPYGKTDTASVLQEASLYIKLLQDQIQMLSSSYTNVRALNSQCEQELEEEEEKEQVDLRSRGLCLVPISFTQKVTKENLIDPCTISRKTNLEKRF
ncbi:Transcription factor protein [Melia azedarach]|uniref:Transcription factor protein n=1 Tax=Melia azedarach TaxID=155640 RepID=A0ACC1YB90_MELAZ|nr:Transcription factor protein [Melia azedarach]